MCGKFLFSGRAVNSTLFVPLSAIASQSAHPTKDTLEHTQQLLDYLATQEDDVLTYKRSDMKLAVHSSASHRHVVVPVAISFFLLTRSYHETTAPY